MDDGETISLEYAKDQFTKLMDKLPPPHREDLLSFAIKNYITAKLNDDESDEGSYTADDVMEDPAALLNSIATEMRENVPMDGILCPEDATLLTQYHNSEFLSKITRYVDAFLYNDEDLDDLVKDEKLNKNYCVDCGSTNTKPFIFISHSMSREELYHVFNTVLPPLYDKTVVDVGSRLGAVLYGAYAYTDANKIIGIETKEKYCDLQKEVVTKFKMANRIEIMNKRIEDTADIIKSADVLILNNVFKFYLPESEHADILRFLRANAKSGAYIISRPDISIALSASDTGIIIDEWLEIMEKRPESHHSCAIIGDNVIYENSSDIVCHVVL